MTSEIEYRILELLKNRAPNWVSQIIFEAHGIHDDENFQAAIQRLEADRQIETKKDQRRGITRAISYYRVTSTDNLLIRDFIEIGSVKVPRVMAAQNPSLFPEDYNEAIEQLAVYVENVERRSEARIKEQLRDYWAKTISIFSILAGLLAVVLGNAPKSSATQSYYWGFWHSLGENFAALIPFCSVVAAFALLTWYIITHAPTEKRTRE